MGTHLARNWWLIALRGVAAIIFGVLAFIWPGITLIALTILFGAYALVDGFLAVLAAVTHHTGSQRWWIVLLEGIVGIAAGIIAFVYPGITAFTLLIVIAAWSIITGILEIWAAIRLRHEINNEWMLILAGILSLLFGVLVAVFPGAGALAVIWIIAAYAVVFGILMLLLGLRLRSSPARQAQPEARSA